MGRDSVNDKEMRGKEGENVSECRAFEACLNTSRAALQAPQRMLPNLNVSLLFPV